MARRCAVTQKGVLTGNNVSHANNKSRRRFLPNLQNVSFMSDSLGRAVQLRLSANAIRTIEHHGGLDAFLLREKAHKLDASIAKLQRVIKKHTKEKAAAQ